MALGEGKYDPLCTYVREKAKAKACIVIIMGGNHGHGFSMQAEEKVSSMEWVSEIPEVLRKVANDIENDLKGRG